MITYKISVLGYSSLWLMNKVFHFFLNLNGCYINTHVLQILITHLYMKKFNEEIFYPLGHLQRCRLFHSIISSELLHGLNVSNKNRVNFTCEADTSYLPFLL